jgi:hypothetical protein
MEHTRGVSHRAWLGAGMVVIAVTGTAFLLMRGRGAPPLLDVRFSDIDKVQAYPVPEGTLPPPLLRVVETGTSEQPLTDVRLQIPSPFPAPVRCDYSGSGDGLQLSVWLRNGRRLDYFACAFPDQLEPLYTAAWRWSLHPPSRSADQAPQT